MPLIQEVPLIEKTRNGNFNILVGPKFLDDLVESLNESLNTSRIKMSFKASCTEFDRAKRLKAYKTLFENAKKQKP